MSQQKSVMQGKYQPYPEYKDSGVEWLGEIPSHWDSVQSCRMFYARNAKACPDDLQLASTQKYGVIYQDDYMKLEGRRIVQVQKGLEILKHIEAGDFVISMRSFQGGIEFCNLIGCVSSAYVPLVSRKWVVPSFFRYIFKSTPYIQALQSTSNLIRDGQALRFENFSLVSLPVISEDEQSVIAAFLDYETARIDTLIAKQQRLIELLQEKRQAVISHAVTKGLNPHAPMKDSGVEWLGQVPEHWLVLTAKYVSDVFVPQRNKPLLNSEAIGVNWATTEDVKSLSIESTRQWVCQEALIDAGSKILPIRSVIASCIGSFGIASINTIPLVINQQLQAFIPNSKIIAEYLQLIILSSKPYFELIGTASTLVYVNREGFENLPVLLPSIQEQEKIVSWVTKEVSRLEIIITRVSSVMSLLQERRTALISAAVTGKIDLRDWTPPKKVSE